MSETLGQSLQRVRTKLGFLSARSFYLDLSKRATLSFNYSYYMKIEADNLIPSEKIISQLCSLLPGENGDEVVVSYCQTLFPEQMKRLLKKEEETAPPKPTKKTKTKALRSYQMELTERQVAMIGDSQESYYLFLIFTLARKGISKKEILKSYQFENFDDAIKMLIDAKLIYIEEEFYFSSFPEYVFPKPETKTLKEIYKKLNLYDSNRDNFFNLGKMKRASFFKRVSPRQAEILMMHLELIFQTIRTADEQDVSYNTEVLAFELSYHQGKVIG